MTDPERPPVEPPHNHPPQGVPADGCPACDAMCARGEAAIAALSERPPVDPPCLVCAHAPSDVLARIGHLLNDHQPPDITDANWFLTRLRERPPVDPLRAEAERIVGNGKSWASRYAFDALRAALASPAAPRPEGLVVERLAEIVSDSLAATTEGTDYAEAPEWSDEPDSPYVLRLTNEILARLSATSD